VASLNRINDRFTLELDGKEVAFKVTTVEGSGGFKAARVMANNPINAFGVSIDDKIVVEYKKAQKSEDKDSLVLTGSGLYDQIRMDFRLPFQLGDAEDLQVKVETSTPLAPELSISVAAVGVQVAAN
jgi:hypothetical protein